MLVTVGLRGADGPLVEGYLHYYPEEEQKFRIANARCICSKPNHIAREFWRKLNRLGLVGTQFMEKT
jgi:hypothetical protein